MAGKAKTANQGKQEKQKETSSVPTTGQKRKTPGRNAKGQFVKGAPKPPASGRKPGTPNKYGNIRDRLRNIVLPYLNDAPDAPERTLGLDLMAIADPKDRIDAVAKILPFVVPKYTSTTISADANRPVAEEERLLELDRQYKESQTELDMNTLTVVDNDNGGKPMHITKEQLSTLNRPPRTAAEKPLL